MRTKPRRWRPALASAGGPIYLAVADHLAADIAAGRLGAGERLPTHRDLAKALGVNLSTITRAYGEAERRGLVEATVGRGTFVRLRPPAAPAGTAPAIDLSMNLPPLPEALGDHVAAGMAALRQRPDFRAALTYVAAAGGEEARAAGSTWLAPRFGALPTNRVLVTAGAQGALLAVLTSFARSGDVVLTEALTYPGFRALAAQFGVRLAGVAVDGQGLVPDALDEACARTGARMLYCIPTIHNPTTATMPLRRRQAVLAVARRRGLSVIEDDAYGVLARDAPPPLAALAPDIVFHVSSLAKCIAPGLRIAYLVAPDQGAALRLEAAVRAATHMTPPLMASLAAQWIADGTASAVVAAIRREAAARQRIARDLLPAGHAAAHPEGHHVWLTLPPAWNRAAFDAYLRQLGLAVVPSDAFAVSASPPEAVRLSLGAAADQARLRRALELVADALGRSPAFLSTVV